VDATLADPLVGRLLDDRYMIVSRIDRGGMATVYHAVDRRLDRDVALKVLHGHLAGDRGFAARFVREARAAARLSHPSVVGVFDQGQDGDLLFLAMEYLPGRTLRHVLVERGALTPKESFRVMDPVLDALAAAHRAGIVHRDVKPENVILTDDGRVKVADFGLARAATSTTATTGVLLGTVAYLAPELVARGVADERSDVYAAGVMLFEMLTGRQPFVGEIPAQVAYRHVHEDVPAPSDVAPTVPEALDDLVLAATGRDPDERPSDAGALLTMLRAAKRRVTPDAMNVRADVAPIGAGPGSVDDDPLDDPFGARLDDSLDHRYPDLGATQAVDRHLLGNRTQALPGLGARADGAGNGAHAGPDDPSRVAANGAGPTRGRLVPSALPVNEPVGTVPMDDAALARLVERRRRRGAVVMALVLATALVLVAGAYWFIAGPGARVPVPATATLTQAEALKKLAEAELTGEATNEFSETVKKGLVIRTEPAAGRTARKGATVTLFVSRGPQLFAVEDVSGKSRADAEQTLTGQGFQVGKVVEQYSDEVPAGTVVSTDPAAGAQRPKGSAITLVVSRGEEPLDVPDVRGRPQADAEQALRDAGFTPVVGAEQQFDDQVPPGSVAAQEPRGGQRLARGGTVTIVISRGAETVEVPDVLGDRTDKAVQKLEEEGFQVEVQRNNVTFRERVAIQSPVPGTLAPRGSTVVVTIF
jgi:serine/threonine-protein kinase